MESDITASEAARRFSDVLNRVQYRGEVFVVKRGGQPVCRIMPVGPGRCTITELAELLRTGPKPDPAYWDDLESIIREQPSLPEVSW